MAHDERLTLWQRRVFRAVVKQAQKPSGEPLTSDDWMAYFRFSAQPSTALRQANDADAAVVAAVRLLRRAVRRLRCSARPAARLRALTQEPEHLRECVELAPPGGITTEVGVLFADLRGFTTQVGVDAPAEANAMLRRFYAPQRRCCSPKR